MKIRSLVILCGFSELIATALSRGDDTGYERALSGSKIGRDGFNCTLQYPKCAHFKPLFEFTPPEDFDNNEL